MTKQDMIDALTSTITNTLVEVGPEETLTGTQCTTLTDAAAGTLETVNPNHDYPPTPR